MSAPEPQLHQATMVVNGGPDGDRQEAGEQQKVLLRGSVGAQVDIHLQSGLQGPSATCSVT